MYCIFCASSSCLWYLKAKKSAFLRSAFCISCQVNWRKRNSWCRCIFYNHSHTWIQSVCILFITHFAWWTCWCKKRDRKTCFCSNQIISYAFAANPVVRTWIETVSPVSPWILLKVKASHFYNLETFSQCKQMAAFPIQELSLLCENRGKFPFHRRLRFKIFFSV